MCRACYTYAMKIGIFDTGAGGRLFADYVNKNCGDRYEIELIIDEANSPYGNRTTDEIIKLTESAIIPLIEKCKVIVLACNTATMAAISYLRDKYSDCVFIGFEPMIKTATVRTRTKKVIVCSTNASKNTPRYKQLKDLFASDIEIYEPDCSTWAHLVDTNQITSTDISNSLGPFLDKRVDVLVLACTHYVAIESLIREVIGSEMTILEPFEAVLRQLNNFTA